MDVRFVALDMVRIDVLRYEAVVLPFFEDERPLRGAPGLFDWRLCGRLSELLLSGRVTGKRDEVTLIPSRPLLPFDKLLLVGCGMREHFERDVFVSVIERVFSVADGIRLRNLVLALPGRGVGVASPTDAIRWFLDTASAREIMDEVILLDDLEAQKLMLPIVEAERRRTRTAREMRDS
jgi:hypothetical protein